MADRADLAALADRYLDALVARDPGRLPLAASVRYTEDGQTLEPGDGLWGTASDRGGYLNLILDPDSGQAAMFATLRENGSPVILVARLQAEQGQVSEIECFVVRQSGGLGPMSRGAELLEAMGSPSPLWAEPIPEGERLSREALIAAADKYFWGLERNDGKKDYSFFADDCERLENGLKTTNNPALRYGEGISERAAPADDFVASLAGMTPRQQFETGYFRFVDRIRDRRFPVVDVERGAVFAFGFFDHSGTVRDIPLSDGRVLESGVREPFTWEIGEAFKIEHGRLKFIEAVMKRCPYGMTAGWG
jgi:hypothetical protein